MLTEVILPTLGLDIEEAVIERWLKAEGEAVAKDEPLLVVETEKASTEISAPASGVLKQILHPAGSKAQVTHTIGFIEVAPAEGSPQGETASSSVAVAAKVRASPAARRAARELGIPLAAVKGSGPGGRVQSVDVELFAKQRGRAAAVTEAAPVAAAPALAPAAPPAIVEGLPGRLVPLSRKRQVTAERMALSAHTVARVTLNVEVDAGELVALRTRLLPVYEKQGARLSYNDILVKVVATALADCPYMNARWTDKGIYLIEPINVGVAMAVADALVVPVIRQADRKKLAEISQELNALLAKAREDRLTLGDMTGGTFTLTNLGGFGVDSFTPIVNPPEAAILGVGRLAERAVGRNGQLVLRPTIALSLSFDHRVVDGAPAAQFLQRVQQLVEEPYLLL